MWILLVSRLLSKLLPSYPDASSRGRCRRSIRYVRDDFTQAVKNVLMGRVANRCSNPACRAATSGPGLEPDSFSNIGVAAHITAASPGGARYDASLSPVARSSVANGIWLCQNCAHLVDVDETSYPTELLQRWKAEAEDQAAAMLQAGTGFIQDSLELRLPQLDSTESLLSLPTPQLPV